MSVPPVGKPAARTCRRCQWRMMSGNSSPSTGPVIGGGTQFLTVAEVANLMRVSKMTVYRLVHSGELPAVRVGRSFRVHAKAVHDYLQTSYFDAG
ncbi:excisionase family DNA binding protein [Nocardia mexicana]|uniref:Excisionase family DNA binding protein n=2 Tax=Nocardia mexicana TaxID=279262 RepID=A0A370HBQ7_9NOCA|nr:excisionase family DNA binding protein [Nocardia mexicana]